jgi:hypothetical protein
MTARTLIATFISVVLMIGSPIVAADTGLSALELIQKVDDNRRKTADSAFTSMIITTCKYGTSGGKLKCVENPRVKIIESAQINTGKDNLDTRSLIMVVAPEYEKGIGMLSYAFNDSDKENETWLYLPALGKVKKIAVSQGEGDSTESANLFGTEISLDDQDTGKLDDYTYEIIETGEYKGRPVAVIESTPTADRLNKSSNGKTQTWIDTERLIALKVQIFDQQGTMIKRIQAGSIEYINNTWVAKNLGFMNLVSQRLTNMKIDKISFGVDIDAEFLTPKALSDEAFREEHMAKLRAQSQ